MRIAIAISSNRRRGGIETYVERVTPALVDAGHEVSFWCETDLPLDRDLIPLPETVERWCVSRIGIDAAIQSLRRWSPDVLFVHGLHGAGTERRLFELAPCAYFAHGHFGLCISGSKTTQFPSLMPCHRKFGAACLAHYFPRRCGGLSPQSMWKYYRKEKTRLNLLRRYGLVLTHSRYMQREYARHGVDARFVRFFLDARPQFDSKGAAIEFGTDPLRVTFVGRTTSLKGGQLLLEALPAIAQQLHRPVRAVFAGDGPARNDWMRQAERVQRSAALLEIEFPGWLPQVDTERLLSESHLLVVPSVWHEPFGLVGLEAARFGVPAVAFDVGGISEWLADGINGYLAPGRAPTAEGLAAAVIRAVADATTHRRLSEGARQMARRFTVEAHIEDLETAFLDAVRRRATTPKEHVEASHVTF